LAESGLFRELNRLMPGRVRQNEPMSRHTTWRIGGPAEIMAEPCDGEELSLMLAMAKKEALPCLVIGAGSNLLVSDAGVRGLVIKIGKAMAGITLRGNEIIGAAGAKLAAVATFAREAELGGFEFSAGIPGTIGGAVVMNAGANGDSIGILVKEVALIDPEGNPFSKTRQEMEFGYRSSVLQRMPGIITQVTFSCHGREKPLIQDDMADYLARRKATQPLGYPNAGSVFKNPPGDSAGRLIDEAGLKGLREGDAQISTLHANFIINLGQATADDVAALMAKIRMVVYDRFGVELIPEIHMAGFED